MARTFVQGSSYRAYSIPTHAAVLPPTLSTFVQTHSRTIEYIYNFTCTSEQDKIVSPGVSRKRHQLSQDVISSDGVIEKIVHVIHRLIETLNGLDVAPASDHTLWLFSLLGEVAITSWHEFGAQEHRDCRTGKGNKRVYIFVLEE